MNIKKSTILVLIALFLLATSSFAQAGPRHRGSHHGYTSHSGHTIVIESHDYYPEYHYNSYRHQQRRHHYNDHHRPTHIYVEKHVYKHESPRVVYQQPQPTYYPPANNYYRGDVVTETVVGGAFGAAAGAAIGAITGNPGKGAALGAVIGGFNGIGRGVFGRGILW